MVKHRQPAGAWRWWLIAVVSGVMSLWLLGLVVSGLESDLSSTESAIEPLLPLVLAGAASAVFAGISLVAIFGRPTRR